MFFNVIINAFQKLFTFLGNVFSWIFNFLSAIYNFLINGDSSGFDSVFGIFSSFSDSLWSFIQQFNIFGDFGVSQLYSWIPESAFTGAISYMFGFLCLIGSLKLLKRILPFW